MDQTVVRILPDLEATRALAGDLCSHVRRGDVIALFGDLGCGKTAFARAFIQEMAKRYGDRGVQEVPSPTFTLVQIYDFSSHSDGNSPDLHPSIWHFDLFRIKLAEEAYELGIEDAFAHGISLIEWPDRLGPLLPAERLDLEMAFTGKGDERRAIMTGHGDWAKRLAEANLDD